MAFIAGQTGQLAFLNALDVSVNTDWATYTVVWTGSTNPVINNGVLVGKWKKTGPTIHFVIEVSIGSTTTLGAGNYVWSLPAAANVSINTCFGAAARDASTGIYYSCFAVPISPTGISLRAHGATTVASPTVPFTWALSDSLLIAGSYQAA